MVPLTLPLFFILIKQTVHHLHFSSVWLQKSSLPCPFLWRVTFSFLFILKALISTNFATRSFHEYAKLQCTNPQKRWDCCTT